MDSFTLNKIEFDAVRRILAGFCRCSLGRNLALRIGPSKSPEVIRHWLDQVSQMVAAIRDEGLPPFGGVTDIGPHLERAQPGGGASGEDFVTIASTLEGAGAVRNYLNALPETLPCLHELGRTMDDFASEVQAIRSIVDGDGTVSDHASERLAATRRQIAQSTQGIHSVIYGYLRQPEVAKLLQNATVTLHGDRYVLPVKAENRGRLPGVVHRSSNTGATVFVEPNACVELNNRLFDLYDDERKEVQRLLSQLSLRISAVNDKIVATLRTLSQVDLLQAKAQYAYQFDMTCPEITERGALVFHQARHPLLVERAHRDEQAGIEPEKRHKVVPIDVRLGQDFDVLVITGSNTGGKTVTLKTVALLAVMAQSGMHIPAQRDAKLPAFRDIFIDIGDEQSLEQSLSTFGAHIKRVRYILRKADPACLVLLDELGSGTDPDEGGAIGQAVLDELRSIGGLAMVTTHLSVLKAYAYNHERVDNASVEFNTETLSPTYHLLIGTPGESHAITVAAHLGLPRRIVGASRQYLNSQGKQFRRAIQATSLVRKDAEEARTAAVAAQLDARTQQEVYEAKLADLHRLQVEFNTWLARLGEMKEGDEVYVPSLAKPGHLVRMELHRQIALVSVDALQIEVPLRELMPNLGQQAVREQINQMRQQLLDSAKATQAALAEARRVQEEYQHSLSQQKERARQFDTWLSMIGRLKVGEQVPIALKPGSGVLSELDFTRLKAKVKVREGDGEKELELSLQDLFPQTGPFAPRPPQHEGRRRGRFDHHRRDEHGHRPQQGEAHAAGAATPEPPPDDRPMIRRSATGKAAQANRDRLLHVQPGQQVYVVPFHKRATLIRINEEKQQAVVQSGVFEMELPLADLEPVRDA